MNKPLTFDDLKPGDVIFEEDDHGIKVIEIITEPIDSKYGRFVRYYSDYIPIEDLLEGNISPEFDGRDNDFFEYWITRINRKYYRQPEPAIRDSINMLEERVANMKKALKFMEAKTGKK